MDPTEQAFLVDLVTYLVAAALVFLLGFASGRAGRAKVARRTGRDTDSLYLSGRARDFRG